MPAEEEDEAGSSSLANPFSSHEDPEAGAAIHLLAVENKQRKPDSDHEEDKAGT